MKAWGRECRGLDHVPWPVGVLLTVLAVPVVASQLQLLEDRTGTVREGRDNGLAKSKGPWVRWGLAVGSELGEGECEDQAGVVVSLPQARQLTARRANPSLMEAGLTPCTSLPLNSSPEFTLYSSSDPNLTPLTSPCPQPSWRSPGSPACPGHCNRASTWSCVLPDLLQERRYDHCHGQG